MTSPTFPCAGLTVAPREEDTFHVPGGPSTSSFTARSNSPVALDRRGDGRPAPASVDPAFRSGAVNTGHSFGDFQSYGPHSSTMMVLRPRRPVSGIIGSTPSGIFGGAGIIGIASASPCASTNPDVSPVFSTGVATVLNVLM